MTLRSRFSNNKLIDSNKTILSDLKKLDVYSKVHDDYTVKTRAGGFLTITAWIIMIVLFICETREYLQGEIIDTITVDNNIDNRLPIELDISFPHLLCDQVSVDNVDSLGRGQANIEGSIEKNDIMKNNEKTGCQIKGQVLVNKVAGNIHVALGKSSVNNGKLVHEFNIEDVRKGFNTSHKINLLRFGDVIPNLESPLEGVTQEISDAKSIMFHYFMKLVPTIYKSPNDEMKYTNQYSVSSTQKDVLVNDNNLTGLPGVYLVYDFTPFLVQRELKYKNFGVYLTSIAAIIGGVFTVSCIIDSLLYSTIKKFRNTIG